MNNEDIHCIYVSNGKLNPKAVLDLPKNIDSDFILVGDVAIALTDEPVKLVVNKEIK